MHMKQQIEIMAPAGSFESLQAAIQAGTGSVYFGVEQLNMRAKAALNFKVEELSKVVKICKEKNVKTYLTLNTVMYDNDLQLIKQICDQAKQAGITAIIACDVAVMQYAKSVGMEVHLSTQVNVSNIEAVRFYAQFADVIVLARELTLEQIKHIVNQIKEQNICGPKGELIQIEIFVHGALCVSISGKCYMSLARENKSANRGACVQVCRRSYKLTDEETGDELVVDNKYIMSPKDLCTIGFLDKIIESGVSVLKIEGRGKSPDYVYKVVKAYREAIESVKEGTYTQEKINAWIKELESVYNRGFWQGGYYLGKKLGEWAGIGGSVATFKKKYIAKGENYFDQKKIAFFIIEAGELKVGDKILITGPTTGVIETTLKSMIVNDIVNNVAKKGDLITFPLDKKMRKNDQLYILQKREQQEIGKRR